MTISLTTGWTSWSAADPEDADDRTVYLLLRPDGRGHHHDEALRTLCHCVVPVGSKRPSELLRNPRPREDRCIAASVAEMQALYEDLARLIWEVNRGRVGCSPGVSACDWKPQSRLESVG